MPRSGRKVGNGFGGQELASHSTGNATYTIPYRWRPPLHKKGVVSRPGATIGEIPW